MLNHKSPCEVISEMFGRHTYLYVIFLVESMETFQWNVFHCQFPNILEYGVGYSLEKMLVCHTRVIYDDLLFLVYELCCVMSPVHILCKIVH